MVRVARPGGRVLVADVAMLASKVDAYDVLERLRDPSHVHALEIGEFAQLFRDANLEHVASSQWSTHPGPIELVKMRASQVNGCAFCLDIHGKDARSQGETEQRLHLLAGWRELSTLGVRISVDDFGTGYSSLSYLRRLPLDKLKIDRTFIREIATSRDDAAIVRAIVSLAHNLRIKVIAEGVETPDQLVYLREVGCDQYQGYHYSAPVPNEAFVTMINEHQSAALAPSPTGLDDTGINRLLRGT